MREHIPSLLMRAGALVRHAGHFYHGFLRMVELGLLRFQQAPRFFHRQVVEESPVHASSSKGEGAMTFTHERQISKEQDLSRAVSTTPEPAFNFERSQSAANAKLIISIHIPKTGGTTFLEVLKASAQEVLYMDYGKGIVPTSLYRKGELLEEQFELIGDIEALPGRSVIHGHFRTAKYLERFPQALYVTWLRDPVERLASHYFFWQRTPFMEDPLCNQVISEKMTLEDFAQLEIARNVQHRFLSPLGVEGFAFVGITEEYERSLELFRRLICPEVRVAPTVLNTNPDRQRIFYELEPGVRERILKLNELDARTYLDGIRRFRRLCEEVGI